MKSKLFFAGSGGQGTLAIGQMIAKAAMDEGKEVTWLPSYGPEMRGGTANCTVVVSDKVIACPLVNEVDVLVAMNLPSLLKFESMVVPGGLLIVNSSIVTEKPSRSDIRVVEVPAVDMAQQLGSEKAANMVVLGAIIEETGVVSKDTVREEMHHMFSGRKEKFLPMNLAALDLYSKE
ncbi:MAG: 2-oxoacid:ferredoxin oxidoreductase subunit gamma [Ruminococcaceae bacterium]|nr:2-oxoacid:ferredoxin oxidoreductase subunit gamma [Oscillospiraceae bacterium]